MKKIFEDVASYVLKGKGIGLRYLFVLACLIGVYAGFQVHKYFSIALPYMQNVVYDVAPIRMENGKIVVPEGTKKEILVAEDEANRLMFVLDTTTDRLDSFPQGFGWYLTQSKLYAVMPGKTQSFDLKGNFDLERKDYLPIMEKYVKIGGAVFGFFAFGFVWLYSLLMVLFYTLVFALVGRIARHRLDFMPAMRLNTVLFIGVTAIELGLSYSGVAVDRLAFFLMMVIAQFLAIKQILPQE